MRVPGRVVIETGDRVLHDRMVARAQKQELFSLFDDDKPVWSVTRINSIVGRDVETYTIEIREVVPSVSPAGVVQLTDK